MTSAKLTQPVSVKPNKDVVEVKESRTDWRRDGFRLHQILIDLPSIFIVVHAVVQILLILHPLLTAAHMTEYGTDITLSHTAV